jgi:hypothetical protein
MDRPHRFHVTLRGWSAAMLFLVIERLAGVLASQPDPVLAAGRIGARRPASTADLPALTVGVVVETERLRGLGRELRLDEPSGQTVLGDLYAGVLHLEVWATSSAGLEQLATRIHRRLTPLLQATRDRGFLRLRPVRIDPAEQTLSQPTVGGGFLVWRQLLEYEFACEVQETPTSSEGGPIRRVNVDIGDGLVEAFSVPSSDVAERPTNG